jgi:hypothetical protein
LAIIIITTQWIKQRLKKKIVIKKQIVWCFTLMIVLVEQVQLLLAMWMKIVQMDFAVKTVGVLIATVFAMQTLTADHWAAV